MNATILKRGRREIRKVIGPTAADLLTEHSIRLAAHAAILHRGFFGRLKWLICGK